MATGSPGNQTRVTPDDVSRWFSVLLMIADSILRLIGRRASDRPERERPEE